MHVLVNGVDTETLEMLTTEGKLSVVCKDVAEWPASEHVKVTLIDDDGESVTPNEEQKTAIQAALLGFKMARQCGIKL